MGRDLENIVFGLFLKAPEGCNAKLQNHQNHSAYDNMKTTLTPPVGFLANVKNSIIKMIHRRSKVRNSGQMIIQFTKQDIGRWLNSVSKSKCFPPFELKHSSQLKYPIHNTMIVDKLADHWKSKYYVDYDFIIQYVTNKYKQTRENEMQS